jgi:hypothetical protein
MTLGSFADLANVRVGDVKPPAVYPAGHYKAIFSGLMKEHKAKSGNSAMRFPFKLLEGGADVDATELAKIAEEQPLGEKDYNIDFWMSADARYRFTDFGKAMGHSDDLTLLELAEALSTAGDPFLIEVKHEPNEDPTKPPFMRFDNPAPWQ